MKTINYKGGLRRSVLNHLFTIISQIEEMINFIMRKSPKMLNYSVIHRPSITHTVAIICSNKLKKRPDLQPDLHKHQMFPRGV